MNRETWEDILEGLRIPMGITKMTDTERFDWLEKQDGAALVSDDGGHWTVVVTGFQNVPKESPGDIQTTLFIEKGEWKSSVREAIDAAMEKDDGTSP